MVDSGYDTPSREDVFKSGVRKFFRDKARAWREGKSIYRSREEMNKAKEAKTLANKAWLTSKRGGAEEHKRKEGLPVTGGRGKGGVGDEPGKDGLLPEDREIKGKISEVESVIFVPHTSKPR